MSARPLPNDHVFTMHLLRRTTFGVTPGLVEDVREAGGTHEWLASQLRPESIMDADCDQVLERFPLRAADPPFLWATQKHFSWGAMDDLVRATFARALWSKRQLFEVMVEFWSNHLNISTPSGDVWSTKPWDDANVIRKHALGRFEDMLVASGQSPAMMAYLDNATSKGTAPNENYGRELLELHTLGRDSGYTQDDVEQCSLALTGLTVWAPYNSAPEDVGTFRYQPAWRHVGPLKVLDWSHDNSVPGAGLAVAKGLYRYLANHPHTARRLARKLAIRFVSDDPPQSLIDRLATVYLENKTAITPVLQALFESSEFAGSVGQKYRRPLEDVVASLRAVGVQPSQDLETRAIGSYCWLLGELGQAPLGWGPPDGYPDVASAWAGAGSLLGRWNLHLSIAVGWRSEGLAHPGDLASRVLDGSRLPTTRHALVEDLHARLLPGIQVPRAHVDHLVTFLGGPGPTQESDLTRSLPVVVALVLNSPLWSVR